MKRSRGKKFEAGPEVKFERIPDENSKFCCAPCNSFALANEQDQWPPYYNEDFRNDDFCHEGCCHYSNFDFAWAKDFAGFRAQSERCPACCNMSGSSLFVETGESFTGLREDPSGFEDPSEFQDPPGLQDPSGFRDYSRIQSPSRYQNRSGHQDRSEFRDTPATKNSLRFQYASGHMDRSAFDSGLRAENPSRTQNSLRFQTPSGHRVHSEFENPSRAQNPSEMQNPLRFQDLSEFQNPPECPNPSECPNLLRAQNYPRVQDPSRFQNAAGLHDPSGLEDSRITRSVISVGPGCSDKWTEKKRKWRDAGSNTVFVLGDGHRTQTDFEPRHRKGEQSFLRSIENSPVWTRIENGCRNAMKFFSSNFQKVARPIKRTFSRHEKIAPGTPTSIHKVENPPEPKPPQECQQDLSAVAWSEDPSTLGPRIRGGSDQQSTFPRRRQSSDESCDYFESDSDLGPDCQEFTRCVDVSVQTRRTVGENCVRVQEFRKTETVTGNRRNSRWKTSTVEDVDSMVEALSSKNRSQPARALQNGRVRRLRNADAPNRTRNVGRGQSSVLRPLRANRRGIPGREIPCRVVRLICTDEDIREAATQVDENCFCGPVPPDALDTRPLGTRPLDTRPLDTRPMDTRPLDTRPLDTRPLDTRPLDTRPLDTRPFDTRPLSTGTLDTGPLDSRPLETKSLDTGPLDSRPLETKSLDTGPLDTRPLDTKSLDTGPLDTRPLDTFAVDTGRSDTMALDTGLATKGSDAEGLDTAALYPTALGADGLDTTPWDTSSLDFANQDTRGLDSTPQDVSGLSTTRDAEPADTDGMGAAPVDTIVLDDKTVDTIVLDDKTTDTITLDTTTKDTEDFETLPSEQDPRSESPKTPDTTKQGVDVDEETPEQTTIVESGVEEEKLDADSKTVDQSEPRGQEEPRDARSKPRAVVQLDDSKTKPRDQEEPRGSKAKARGQAKPRDEKTRPRGALELEDSKQMSRVPEPRGAPIEFVQAQQGRILADVEMQTSNTLVARILSEMRDKTGRRRILMSIKLQTEDIDLEDEETPRSIAPAGSSSETDSKSSERKLEGTGTRKKAPNARNINARKGKSPGSEKMDEAKTSADRSQETFATGHAVERNESENRLLANRYKDAAMNAEFADESFEKIETKSTAVNTDETAETATSTTALNDRPARKFKQSRRITLEDRVRLINRRKEAKNKREKENSRREFDFSVMSIDRDRARNRIRTNVGVVEVENEPGPSVCSVYRASLNNCYANQICENAVRAYCYVYNSCC